MRRKVVVGAGEVQQVAAACARVLRGVDVTTGEALGEAQVVERASWLTALVGDLADALVREHWNEADLAQLASGIDRLGVMLPSQAWMALRRLGWAPVVPEGVYVSDRVVRMVQEQAGRVLRSAWWRAQVTAAVLATWPADPERRTTQEWEALRAVLPDDGGMVASGVVKARTRQIAAHRARHGVLPTGLTDCEDAPRAGGQVLLAAVDKQLAVLERCDQDPAHYAVLTVRLPVRPDPTTRADWHPVRLRFRLPPRVPAGAVLCPPILRLRQGRLLLDVPYAHAVPKPERSGHRVAVAFDWVLNTLLTGGRLHLTGEAQPDVVADERPLFFRADGVMAKAHRLRLQGEHLHTRITALDILTASRTERGLRPDPWVRGKLAVLETERERVARKRTRLNAHLTRAAARAWSTMPWPQGRA
ncbi:zinc ribbon domain-containing protein [Streptomyces fractus]|uniref:zinc ribbon domain-containing protein n=1 Tax=Streptomyces fractus TaxID=641806 RepID=UPI003CF174CB